MSSNKLARVTVPAIRRNTVFSFSPSVTSSFVQPYIYIHPLLSLIFRLREMDQDSNSDPNLEANDLPILSYLLSQLDSSNHPTLSPQLQQSLFSRYPHLTNPKVVASIAEFLPTSASQTHSHLLALGPKPDPDAVSAARSKFSQAEEEQGTSSEIGIYKAILRLEELHQEYQRQLKEAEKKLDGAYWSVVRELENDSEVNEEIISVLKEAERGVVERVELAGRQLRFLPEAFGRIRGLVVLNLSRNQLEVLPDSIAGLKQLEELDVSSNLLESLPDSIGLLLSLKVLNVSGNKLKSLPESIAGCRSLVELDASFNNMVCLPSNIGFGLPNLERLSIQLNKIPFLPPSICEMSSLRFLDVHFNELRGLPRAIGRLTNIEVLNLSSNFNDFKELPETISDLINLRELDLSNNQIRVLPDSFGRLEKLTKLNLDENPLVIPPLEIVNRGVVAVREFMIKRWHDIVAEEQQRSMVETNMQQGQTGWLAWGSSLLNDFVSGVSQSATGLLGGGKAPRDPYLDQQL